MRQRAGMVGVGLACAAILGGVAGGQTLRPLGPEAAAAEAPGREWTELFQVEKEHSWRAIFRVRAVVLPGPMKDEEGAKSTIQDVRLVMPWVPRCATQRSDPGSVQMHVWLNGQTVSPEYSWLEHPLSTERLRGAQVLAPAGSEIPFGGSPDASGSPGLLIDMDVMFEAKSRGVRMQRRVAGEAVWPQAWPAEAQAASESQVFLDTAVDPITRLVRPIDVEALDEYVADILKTIQMKEPRKRKPLDVVVAVTGEVCKRVGYLRSGVIVAPKSSGGGIPSTMPRVEGLPVQDFAFNGLDVRDALSVVRAGIGTGPDRAVALAAVLRRVGIPARLIVAAAAQADDDDKIAKRLRPPPPPPKPPSPCSAPDVPTEFSVPEIPDVRVWVEVAMVHPENGWAWVPIDTGKGGATWKVGSVDRGEDFVVLATNLWPPGIERVGLSVPQAQVRVRMPDGESTPSKAPEPKNQPPRAQYGFGPRAFYGPGPITPPKRVDRPDKKIVPSGIGDALHKKKTPVEAEAQSRGTDLGAGMWGFWIPGRVADGYSHSLLFGATRLAEGGR